MRIIRKVLQKELELIFLNMLWSQERHDD